MADDLTDGSAFTAADDVGCVDERVTALREALEALAETRAQFSLQQLATAVKAERVDLTFRLDVQQARDALRKDGIAEFGPVRGKSGMLVVKSGKATLDRSKRFRRTANRKLARVVDMLSTIDPSELDGAGKHALELAQNKTSAMLAFAQNTTRKRTFT